MKYLYVPVTKAGVETQQMECVYHITEVPLTEIMLAAKESTSRQRKKVENGKDIFYKVHYLEIPCAYDIETTNIFQRTERGNVDTDHRPYAYMYHWQMCIGNYVVFGRTWEEWIKTLKYININMHLDDKTRLVVWVHNLAFEFQFFRRFLQITDGFYKDPYKPLRVCCSLGIEFRDSMALSNMSLSAFCKSSPGCIHYKAVGDLDYSVIRTAETPLTDAELAYCYNDVAGLSECIAARMRDDTLASMPMTSTGYVRRDARNAMRRDTEHPRHDNKRNRRIFTESALLLSSDELQPGETENDRTQLYDMFRRTFRGGNTHANGNYAGQTVTEEIDGEKISAWDITSSYPAVIMEEKYPVGRFSRHDPEYQREHDPDMTQYSYIFEVHFTRLEYTGSCGIPYISISKLDNYLPYIPERDNETGEVIPGDEFYLEDNGRIRKAGAAAMTVTETDYKIICKSYKWDTIEIRNMWAAKKDYLPPEFRGVVMDYFRQKTQLKGLKDADSKYMYERYKRLLNALFGMCTMHIDQDLVLYTPGEEEEYTYEGKPLLQLLEKFYKSRNSFLPYQWGVYYSLCTRAP